MSGNDNVCGSRFFAGHKEEESSTFSDVVTASSVQSGILNPLASLSQKIDRMNAVAPRSGSEKAALFLTACEETVRHAVKSVPSHAQIAGAEHNSEPMTFQKR